VAFITTDIVSPVDNDSAYLMNGWTGDPPVTGDTWVYESETKEDGHPVTIAPNGLVILGGPVPTATQTFDFYVTQADETVGDTALYIFTIGNAAPIITDAEITARSTSGHTITITSNEDGDIFAFRTVDTTQPSVSGSAIKLLYDIGLSATVLELQSEQCFAGVPKDVVFSGGDPATAYDYYFTVIDGEELATVDETILGGTTNPLSGDNPPLGPKKSIILHSVSEPILLGVGPSDGDSISP